MTESLNMSCYSYLKKCTADFGGSTKAMLYLGHRITLKNLINDIDFLASYFQSIGLKTGDVFTIFLPTTVHGIVAFYALNKVGVIAGIVHPLTPPAALLNHMRQTSSKGLLMLNLLSKPYMVQLDKMNSKVILCSHSDYVGKFITPAFKIYDSLTSHNPNTHTNIIKYSDAIKMESDYVFRAVPNGDDVAVYLHSGGTSGESKIVMLQNSALNSIALKVGKLDVAYHKPGEECAPAVLPLFHAFGLGVCVHFTLCNGFCCIPIPHFNPGVLNSMIRRYNITVLIGVPNMFEKMMAQNNFRGYHLKKLRLMFSGGDTVNESLLNAFNLQLKNNGCLYRLMRGYGLTEVSSVCCTNSENFSKKDSIGKPLDGVMMKIWDERQKDVLPNIVGEIVVGGSTLMKGYFSPNSEDKCGIYIDEKGEEWIKTGDLGYVDENGFFYLTGRKKRIIIISGYNVYPNEIEKAVSFLPFIKESCAIEDNIQGKPIIKLFVSLRDKNISAKSAEEKILKHCEANLSKYSRPTKIEIMNELPRTEFGKIDFMKLEN